MSNLVENRVTSLPTRMVRNPFDPFESPFFKRFLNTFEEFEVEKYPPTNVDIVRPKTGEPYYRLEMAVSGFTKKDLTIRVDGSMVSISGERLKEVDSSGDDEIENVQHQIASRKFARRFTFGNVPVEVKNATCKDGMLRLEVHFARPPEGELVPIK